MSECDDRAARRNAFISTLIAATLVVSFFYNAPAYAASLGQKSIGSAPTPQAMVYYNARIAQREHRAKDVLRLWFLRNSLTDKGEAPLYDADFRSLVWAAVAEAGYCHDGLIEDTDGAGLWPLALHNWLLKSSSKLPAPEQAQPFLSFQAGLQQRHVSLYDVLSSEEHQSLRFFRGFCLTPYMTLLRLSTVHWLDLRDRLSVGIMMRELLVLAKSTLSANHIESKALIDVRLFDLDVALSELALRKIKSETGLMSQLARSIGVSESGAQLRRAVELKEFVQSEKAKFLKSVFYWPVESWFSLSPNRRLALFQEANPFVNDPAARDRTLLAIIDRLIREKNGNELTQWIGIAGQIKSTTLRGDLTLGDRGLQLLGLPTDSGFREQSTIALHRGIWFLHHGAQQEALRAIALSLMTANFSSAAEANHDLAKRWLTFVLSIHQTDDEVLSILTSFVPRIDYNQIIDILLWRAALHGDNVSFSFIEKSIKPNATTTKLIDRLRPLVASNPQLLWQGLQHEHVDAHGRYAFAVKLIDELSLEPLDVRAHHRSTLQITRRELDTISTSANASLQKKLDKLNVRIQTILDSLGDYDNSITGKINSNTPDYESYAGSIRLAPADSLPWPFPIPAVEAPNPFQPILLIPFEETIHSRLRFRWRISEP